MNKLVSIIVGIVLGVTIVIIFHTGSGIQIYGQVTPSTLAYSYMGFFVAINALFFFITYNKKPEHTLKKIMTFLSSFTGTYGILIFVTVPPF